MERLGNTFHCIVHQLGHVGTSDTPWVFQYLVLDERRLAQLRDVLACLNVAWYNYGPKSYHVGVAVGTSKEEALALADRAAAVELGIGRLTPAEIVWIGSVYTANKDDPEPALELAGIHPDLGYGVTSYMSLGRDLRDQVAVNRAFDAAAFYADEIIRARDYDGIATLLENKIAAFRGQN